MSLTLFPEKKKCQWALVERLLPGIAHSLVVERSLVPFRFHSQCFAANCLFLPSNGSNQIRGLRGDKKKRSLQFTHFSLDHDLFNRMLLIE